MSLYISVAYGHSVAIFLKNTTTLHQTTMFHYIIVYVWLALLLLCNPVINADTEEMYGVYYLGFETDGYENEIEFNKTGQEEISVTSEKPYVNSGETNKTSEKIAENDGLAEFKFEPGEYDDESGAKNVMVQEGVSVETDKTHANAMEDIFLFIKTMSYQNIFRTSSSQARKHFINYISQSCLWFDYKTDIYTTYNYLLKCVKEIFDKTCSRSLEKEKTNPNWDDLISKGIPPKVIENSVIISSEERNLSTSCLVDHGSFSYRPQMQVCQQDQRKNSSCSEENKNIQIIHEDHVCFQSHEMRQLLRTYQVTWYLAKTNYLIILGPVGFTLTHKTLRRMKSSKKSAHFISVFVVSTAWQIWRLQETLHWEIRWQWLCPYTCVVTNYLQYLTEAVSLYLFACTAFLRYKAIAEPLMSFVKQKGKQMNVASIGLGCVVAIICSSLNTVALGRMTDPSILRKCIIEDAAKENLAFLIAAKTISTVLIYIVPCLLILSCNIAMVTVIKRTSRQAKRNFRRPTSKKTKLVITFILLSSLVIVCCLCNPLYDLYKAVDAVYYDESTGAAYVDVLLTGIMWHITSVAYALNGVVTIQYS